VNFHAAVYRLVNHLRRQGEAAGRSLDRSLAGHPFLHGYLEAMAPFLPDELDWDETLSWWERQVAAWEGDAAGQALPLVALTRQGVVNFDTRMALLTTGLVEEDARFGAVFADLQHPLQERRPCLDTVAAVAGGGDAWSVGATLLAAGLVEPANPHAPRPEWLLRVAPDLWEVLRGQPEPALAAWCRHRPRDRLADLDELAVPTGLADRLRAVPELLASGQAGALVLRGMRGSDRRAVSGAVARSLGRGVLLVDAERVPGEDHWRRVGPLCTALGALPVLVYDLPPGESVEVPTLVGYEGPVVVVLGREGGVRGDALGRSVTVELPPAEAQERRRHWERALAGHPIEDVELVSERLHLPPAHIRQAATIAIAVAALDRRETVTVDDVRDACRTLNRQLLDTLAVRLEPAGSWEQLVVSDLAGAKLRELERRCRHRERLLGRLAPAFLPGTNRGVRALFTGASGTGKTLAAKILAAELGMDLYRVDLAAIVNKYVGETEKNLHRVLSTAEELDVLLLIDEGDALLGARTEVRSANDRFANLETNYLLQRLETYQGIVVVTTNAGENIDSAFQRRMEVVVNFVEPGPLERWHIWQIHLPDDHQVPFELLRDVAERCAMTGGQVRNAALHATLLALDDGGIMHGAHLEAAVAAEYGKAGAISPLDPSGRREHAGGVQAFLEALS
jgi:SpoVK/Ycf46/Vps4 family AAA+-type ATPase